jgi:hypothetical protein
MLLESSSTAPRFTVKTSRLHHFLRDPRVREAREGLLHDADAVDAALCVASASATFPKPASKNKTLL